MKGRERETEEGERKEEELKKKERERGSTCKTPIDKLTNKTGVSEESSAV